MYVCIFQPGNFTGLGSEEVKNATSTAKIIGGVEGGSMGAGGWGGGGKCQKTTTKQKQTKTIHQITGKSLIRCLWSTYSDV